MQSLSFALELMIEYHHVITLVPKSIVNQLRQYKTDKSRLQSKGIWNLLPWKKQKDFYGDSIQKLISESSKLVVPVAAGENISHRTIMLIIEDEKRIQYKTGAVFEITQKVAGCWVAGCTQLRISLGAGWLGAPSSKFHWVLGGWVHPPSTQVHPGYPAGWIFRTLTLSI